MLVRPVREPIHFLQGAEEVGLLNDQRVEGLRLAAAERVRVDRAGGGERQLDQLHLLIAHDRAGRLQVAWMNAAGDEDAARGPLAVRANRHQHGLGQPGGAVVDRGVRDVEPGQRGHHRLVLVDGLERPLARLRLVGRVGGEELAPRDEVPDRGRDVVVVASAPGEAEHVVVARRPRGQVGHHVHLARARGHPGERRRAQTRRNLVEQRLDAVHPDRLEHRRDVGFRVRDEGHGVILLARCARGAAGRRAVTTTTRRCSFRPADASCQPVGPVRSRAARAGLSGPLPRRPPRRRPRPAGRLRRWPSPGAA